MIKAIAKKVVDPNDKIAFMDVISNSGIYEELEKSLEISVEEIFVDGIQFDIKAFENFERQAVEKQQAMQLTQLLLPFRGQPFTNDAGAPVQVDDYKIITDLAFKFGMEDIWKPMQAPQGPPDVPTPQVTGGSPQQPTAPQTPNLNQSPVESDILAGAVQT